MRDLWTNSNKIAFKKKIPISPVNVLLTIDVLQQRCGGPQDDEDNQSVWWVIGFGTWWQRLDSERLRIPSCDGFFLLVLVCDFHAWVIPCFFCAFTVSWSPKREFGTQLCNLLSIKAGRFLVKKTCCRDLKAACMELWSSWLGPGIWRRPWRLKATRRSKQ